MYYDATVYVWVAESLTAIHSSGVTRGRRGPARVTPTLVTPLVHNYERCMYYLPHTFKMLPLYVVKWQTM